MDRTLYWFRTDLRLTDNPAFCAAIARSKTLLPVYVISPDEAADTTWSFSRWGPHRRRFRDQALAGLKHALVQRGSDLHVIEGEAAPVLARLAHEIGADRVVCEAIAAPEEIAEVEALRRHGLVVEDVWQSSLIDPLDLPFPLAQLPDSFTPFRKALQSAGVMSRPALTIPSAVPPLPQGAPEPVMRSRDGADPDRRSSFPFNDPAFDGAERAALAHVDRYFGSSAPQTYKATRNGLSGAGFSTKFSPWLAVGAVSARTIFAALTAHEAKHGASDGTEWIVFELLWRDYFRFSSLKYGKRLFRAGGLSAMGRPAHDPEAFQRWCTGRTGQPFVDAGMRELAETGFLSNRLRQIVASYLVHDLACDWRAGAAWFEARLIDHDICSNYGNWLYIAGRGTDPRGGRRFDPVQQATHYDPSGDYRRLWDADSGASLLPPGL